MTAPLPREETERMRKLAEAATGPWESAAAALVIAAYDPAAIRELIRGYEAWRDGIEKIERRIAEIDAHEDTEPKLMRWARKAALQEALDALRAGKP